MGKEKEYKIKIPVYVTTLENNGGTMFQDIVTYDSLIAYLKKRIDETSFPINIENNTKLKSTIIKEVSYECIKISEIPSLLIKMSSFDTNLRGYFESEKKVDIDRNDRIGGEDNYVLFYPIIETVPKYKCYFLILVYEDPYKDSGEVSKLSKKMTKMVLNKSIYNLKMDSILNELQKIGTIPELQVTYRSINNEDELRSEYKDYIVENKVEKKKEKLYRYIPYRLVRDILKEDDGKTYETKVYKISFLKKEIKIKKKLKLSKELITEMKDLYEETAEKVFNYSCVVTQEDLDNKKIYDMKFIIEKMRYALNCYLAYDDTGE